MDINRPHTAIINVQVEINALDDIGQCSGKILSESALAKHGLRPATLFYVTGINAEECMQKVKEKLKVLNE
jgi:hypothetical protein